jgi:hypothetical protein
MTFPTPESPTLNATNPDLKTRWLAALRSGEYKQTKEYLRTPDGFCCLGVLCDLYDPTVWDSVRDADDDHNYNYNFTSIGRSSFETLPPSEIAELVDLTEDDCNALAGLNDEGMSFKQIADIIEKRTYKEEFEGIPFP